MGQKCAFWLVHRHTANCWGHIAAGSPILDAVKASFWPMEDPAAAQAGPHAPPHPRLENPSSLFSLLVFLLAPRLFFPTFRHQFPFLCLYLCGFFWGGFFCLNPAWFDMSPASNFRPQGRW